MYQDIWNRILESLCRAGTVFFRPDNARSQADERIMDAVVPATAKNAGFEDDIPGNSYFTPSGLMGNSYYPPEKHLSHVEIVFAASGNPELYINYNWVTLESGRVYILLRNTVHTERHRDGESYTLYWLSCLPEMLTLHRTAYSGSKKHYSQSACRIAVSMPMARFLWECAAESRVNECHFFSLLVQCVDYAAQQKFRDDMGKDYYISVLNQLKVYIDENYFRPITLADLAEMAHWSVVHLCRRFVAQYGMTVHKYISQKRLKASAAMLAAGVNTANVAINSGFSDPRYFRKVFKNHTGMTPAEYAATFYENT